jgi:hypothetical protein
MRKRTPFFLFAIQCLNEIRRLKEKTGETQNSHGKSKLGTSNLYSEYFIQVENSLKTVSSGALGNIAADCIILFFILPLT